MQPHGSDRKWRRLGAGSRPHHVGETARFPAELASSAPKVLLTITVEGSSSQSWAGSKEAGAGKRVSTALPGPLPSLTPLQEQHSEYIVGVTYRASKGGSLHPHFPPNLSIPATKQLESVPSS